MRMYHGDMCAYVYIYVYICVSCLFVRMLVCMCMCACMHVCILLHICSPIKREITPCVSQKNINPLQTLDVSADKLALQQTTVSEHAKVCVCVCVWNEHAETRL